MQPATVLCVLWFTQRRVMAAVQLLWRLSWRALSRSHDALGGAEAAVPSHCNASHCDVLLLLPHGTNTACNHRCTRMHGRYSSRQQRERHS